MKKKKIRFAAVKPGEYFKSHGVVFRKGHVHGIAACLAGNSIRRFFMGCENVIPVTVTIKVKEN